MLHFLQYLYYIDTNTNTITIVSAPSENLITIPTIADISLVVSKDVVETIVS
jgi:hypothetical protein